MRSQRGRMRRRAIVLVLTFVAAASSLLWLAARPGLAADGPVLLALQTADRLYANGDYALAAQTYQQLVDQGYADAALYYNLGVAFYRAGDLGRSLWSLRRAQEIAPRADDLRTALAEVRQAVAGRSGSAAADSLPRLERWVYRTRPWVTLNECAALALAAWLALLSALALRLFNQRGRWLSRLLAVLTVAATMTFASSGMLLAARGYSDWATPAAVVIAPDAQLLSAPGIATGEQVTLAAGSEVSVLERRGDWVQVQTAGAQGVGWTEAAAIAIVTPVSASRN